MSLKYPDTIESNNISSTGYPIVKGTQVSGCHNVADLDSLYQVYDYILSPSGDNTDNDAIGFKVYVVAENALYKLVNWKNRNSADGWKRSEGLTSEEAAVLAELTELWRKGDGAHSALLSDHAEDENTNEVLADYAVNAGSNSIIYEDGTKSFVEGNLNTIGGTDGGDTHESHAEGGGNTINGNATGSHAEGYNNIISDNAAISHVEGTGNVIYDYSTISHVEGANNTAEDSSNISHIEGTDNKAQSTANLAHIEGAHNTISTYMGHAEGNGNTISGNSNVSHVEGNNNNILEYSDASHVEGNSNSVDIPSSHSGAVVHIEGSSNIVNNNAIESHTEGVKNTVQTRQTHVEGVYNSSLESISQSTPGFDTMIANHIEGLENIATDIEKVHIEGIENRITTLGISHIEGLQNTISYPYTQSPASKISGLHIEGMQNVISETSTDYSYLYNHMEGGLNKLLSVEGGFSLVEYNHIEGYNNKLYNAYNHAEGINNELNAQASHIEGYGNSFTVTQHNYMLKAAGNHISGNGNMVQIASDEVKGMDVHGTNNTIYAGVACGAYISGAYNHVGASSNYTSNNIDFTIIGGTNNSVGTDCNSAAFNYNLIFGGNNTLNSGGCYDNFVTGFGNTIKSSSYSNHITGDSNTITEGSYFNRASGNYVYLGQNSKFNIVNGNKISIFSGYNNAVFGDSIKLSASSTEHNLIMLTGNYTSSWDPTTADSATNQIKGGNNIITGSDINFNPDSSKSTNFNAILASNSCKVGSQFNTILSSSGCTIGYSNSAWSGGIGDFNAIIASTSSYISQGNHNIIISGSGNEISMYNSSDMSYNSIYSGTGNTLSYSVDHSHIIGGFNNNITNLATTSIIINSIGSHIGESSTMSTIISGWGDSISNSSDGVVVFGNSHNVTNSSYRLITFGDENYIQASKNSIIGGIGHQAAAVINSAIVGAGKVLFTLTNATGGTSGTAYTIVFKNEGVSGFHFNYNDIREVVSIGSSFTYSGATYYIESIARTTDSKGNVTYTATLSGAPGVKTIDATFTNSYAEIGGSFVGGSTNTVSSNLSSSLLVGSSNTTGTSTSLSNAIIGGSRNNVYESNNLIVSGTRNTTYQSYNEFISGYNNSTSSSSNNIIGGNNNSVYEAVSSIVAGANNQVYNNSARSIIVGQTNTIQNATDSIVAGSTNTLQSGSGDCLVMGSSSTIAGYHVMSIGYNNTSYSGIFNAIMIGANNSTRASDSYIFGTNNVINSEGSAAQYTLIKGYGNSLYGNAINNTILGANNKLQSNGGCTYDLIHGYMNTVGGNIYSSIVLGTFNVVGKGTSYNSYMFVNGCGNTVDANNSFVFGVGNQVEGEYNYVFGNGPVSTNYQTGEITYSESSTKISGYNNFVVGPSEIISGNNNAIFGECHTVTGNDSAIFGANGTMTGGYDNILIGKNTSTNDNGVIIFGGEVSSNGSTGSIVGGGKISLTSSYCVAAFGGNNTVTEATNSLIEGGSNILLSGAHGSHVEGKVNSTSGYGCHTEGVGSRAWELTLTLVSEADNTYSVTFPDEYEDAQRGYVTFKSMSAEMWTGLKLGSYKVTGVSSKNIILDGTPKLTSGTTTLSMMLGTSDSAAHAEGNACFAGAPGAHAEGTLCRAESTHSHAGGYKSYATGNECFVHAEKSEASGYDTAILGCTSTNISGMCNVALGVGNFDNSSLGDTYTTYVSGLSVVTNGTADKWSIMTAAQLASILEEY